MRRVHGERGGGESKFCSSRESRLEEREKGSGDRHHESPDLAFPLPSSTLCLEPLALGRDDVLRHDMRLTTNHKDGDTHLLPRGT